MPGLLFKAAALRFLLGDCSFSWVKLVSRGDGVEKGKRGGKRPCSNSCILRLSQLLSSFSLQVSWGCLRGQQVAVLPKRSNNDAVMFLALCL